MQLRFLEWSLHPVALSYRRTAAIMAPAQQASRLRGTFLGPLLTSAAYICLLLNPTACFAVPRSMLQARPPASLTIYDVRCQYDATATCKGDLLAITALVCACNILYHLISKCRSNIWGRHLAGIVANPAHGSLVQQSTPHDFESANRQAALLKSNAGGAFTAIQASPAAATVTRAAANARIVPGNVKRVLFPEATLSRRLAALLRQTHAV